MMGLAPTRAGIAGRLFVASLCVFLPAAVGTFCVVTSQERERSRPPVEKTPDKGADRGADEGIRGVQAGPGDVPKEDQLYVWAVPEKGTQSVLVLRVVDGDTVEAAYLVPVMLRLNRINAPERGTPEGKKAEEALSRLVGGKLLAVNVHGRDKYGRVLADVYLSKEDGWLSDKMVKEGHAKPWDGKGQRP